MVADQGPATGLASGANKVPNGHRVGLRRARVKPIFGAKICAVISLFKVGEIPTNSPPPSGDYSYTLEIVMQVQVTMGKLMEALETLKADSREHRAELKTISQDVHGAKVGFRWVVGVCVFFGGLA